MKFKKVLVWMIAMNLFASILGASALAEGQTGQMASTNCAGVSGNAGSGSGSGTSGTTSTSSSSGSSSISGN